MMDKLELKDKLIKSNNTIVELFDELFQKYEEISQTYNTLYNNYDTLNNTYSTLNKEYEDLARNNNALKKELSIKSTKESRMLEAKFGINNLARVNEEAIFDAINYFNKSCPYCKMDLYEGNIRKKIEIDHFFPISKGGQDVPWNLLPICKDCNRKKRDRLPSEYLDNATYDECNNYLKTVLTRLTNNHEDKLQRDEMTNHLIKNLNTNKLSINNFISQIFMLFNVDNPLVDNIEEKIKRAETTNNLLNLLTEGNITKDILTKELLSLYNISMPIQENTEVDINSVINEIVLNKSVIFDVRNGTYTTVKKIAETLFDNNPSRDQKISVKKIMSELFQDCRSNTNPSYYSINDCLNKIKLLEETAKS